MVKKLLGTAITDENGVATFTYTGTGAGKMNIVAESGGFVSETFVVLDTLFYDGMITGNDNNSSWSKTSCTFQVTDNGTVFTPSANWGNASLPNGAYYSNIPLRIEFEVVSYQDVPRLYLGRGVFAPLNATGKYVIEIYSDKITVTRDGGTPTTLSAISNTTIGFSAPNTDVRLTVKDFKIYPI